MERVHFSHTHNHLFSRTQVPLKFNSSLLRVLITSLSVLTDLNFLVFLKFVFLPRDLCNTIVSPFFLKKQAAQLQNHPQKRLETNPVRSFWDHDPDDKQYHKNPQSYKSPFIVNELLYKSLLSSITRMYPNTENNNQKTLTL